MVNGILVVTHTKFKPRRISPVAGKKFISIADAVKLLRERLPEEKHFKAATIRKAALLKRIKNAQKFSDRYWMFYEDDLLEWAENEQVHKPGPQK